MNEYDFGSDREGIEAYIERHYNHEKQARMIAEAGKVKLLDIEWGTTATGSRKTVTIKVTCQLKIFWLEYAEDTDTYRNLQGAKPITMVNVSFHEFGGKIEGGFVPAHGLEPFLTFSKGE